MDPNGDVYYVALNTNEQKRQHPLDHTYRHVFLEAKYGAQPGGDYLVLLLEMVKSRHLVDRVAAATMAELGRAAGIFGRLDPERGGRITLANFVLAMNALDVAQGKPLHKDTKLLAMFKADGLHTRHLLDREYTQGHTQTQTNTNKHTARPDKVRCGLTHF